MEDVVQALMIAFGALLFVIGFSVAMYMFSQVTTTAETLTFYADTTAYYDNVKIDDSQPLLKDDDIKNGKSRVVNAETIIPTLYRYADEEFCVKIYDESGNLIQILDLDLEQKVHSSIGDTRATNDSTDAKQIANYAYKKIYNDSTKQYYMFGAPWLGTKENIKTRVDFLIKGQAGYIGDQYVNYTGNNFHEYLETGNQFKETFISYSWSGQTLTTDDGDTLVTGDAPKDKIVIIYQVINNNDLNDEENP